jgi:hypothetical protein
VNVEAISRQACGEKGELLLGAGAVESRNHQGDANSGHNRYNFTDAPVRVEGGGFGRVNSGTGTVDGGQISW